MLIEKALAPSPSKAARMALFCARHCGGAARQRRILRHPVLERQALVRLEAIVNIGVQIREPPSLHHLTTRKCGTALDAGHGRKRRAGQRRHALTGLRQPRNQRRQRDIKSRSRLLVGESGENDDQQRFSELQRQHADCRRHANPARGRFAVRALRILVPSGLPIVEGQATNMPAMKSNKLAKRAHARVTASRPVGVASNASTHRFQRSLPEQTIDKRRRRRMIDHEPVVSRQRHPKSAQVREVGQTVA